MGERRYNLKAMRKYIYIYIYIREDRVSKMGMTETTR